MRRSPSHRGPRAELALLVVLLVGAGSLGAWRVVAGGSGGRSIEEAASGVNVAGLRCLKRVVERAPEWSRPGKVTVAGVAEGVERIRELSFEEVPQPEYLSPEELAERARVFADEYTQEQAAVEEQVLSALGAIEPGTDLREIALGAMGQVAGYYEPESGELIVAGTDDPMIDELEELILAHELTHALTDQVLGLPSLGATRPGEEDALAARRALAEGDAALTEAMYSGHGFLSASASLPLLGATTPLPYYVQRAFTFPYAEGLGYACRRFEAAGWPAIDEAYGSPPTTTYEILFPDAGRVAASDPRDAPSLTGWDVRATIAWGAADLLFLFEAPGNSTGRSLHEPLRRVAGWRGGEVHVLGRGADSAVLLALESRDPGLCTSVQEWYSAAFPGDAVRQGPGGMMAQGERQDAVLRCGGAEIRLGIAPDVGTARRLAG